MPVIFVRKINDIAPIALKPELMPHIQATAVECLSLTTDMAVGTGIPITTEAAVVTKSAISIRAISCIGIQK